MIDGSTHLLALPGFDVLEVAEADGELVVSVQTTASRTRCPRCGRKAEPKDRRVVELRDLPVGTKAVRIRWRKRIWSCPNGRCRARSWTETSWLARPRNQLTERAREEIGASVGPHIGSVAAAARRFGVGWRCAWDAVVSHGRPLVEDRARLRGVRAVGLDETTFRHGCRKRRRQLVTGVVDTDTGRLLDVFEGREAEDLRWWMAKMPRAWLRGIEVVSLDPHEGYRSAIRRSDPLTNKHSAWSKVTVVVDPFHVVRLANQAVTRCRQRVQQHVLGHRGWKGDPLYGIRRLLLLGAERLDEAGWARLEAALRRGDPHDEVVDAWVAKEKVRDIYLTDDEDEAARRLEDAIAWCTTSSVREVRTLAKALRRWRTEILAHHATGASNGPTEAVNLTIKQVKRIGRGFRNFENYRLRLLLAAGGVWQTPSVMRIRGRHPGLVA